MADNQNHQFGISSWSYPWAVGVSKGPRLKGRLGVMEILENARSLGVRLVQYSDNLPLENLPWETMVKLKRVSTEYNIDLEVGTKGVEPGHLLKFLEIATFLKSPVLRTLPAPFGEYIQVKELEKKLRKVLPEFEKKGVVIVLENQESYEAAELAGLMEKINHPNLRICLDLVNGLGAMEGPEYVMDKLGPWCGNFHFKDVSVIRSQTHMEFLVEGRSAGNGNIPVKWALEKLKGYGITHTTIIELWTPWQGDIESTVKLEEDWVAESVEYLRGLF